MTELPAKTEFIVDAIIDSRNQEARVWIDTPAPGVHSLLDLVPTIAGQAVDILVHRYRQPISGRAAINKRLLTAEDVTVVGIRKGGETQTYVIAGRYPGDGGPFGDRYEAVDADDAEFQAMQVMADNDNLAYGWSDKDIRDNVSYMARCDVDVELADKVSKEEMGAALLNLWRASASGESRADAETQAHDVLVRAGLIMGPTAEVLDDEYEETDEEEDDLDNSGPTP